MLVYANSFVLSNKTTTSEVIGLIAGWAGQPRKVFVDPERLASGIRELRFADGASLSSVVTLDDDQQPIFPYYFCSKLTHGQPDVPGRRWTTEVGVRRMSPEGRVECSVLLKTDEISTKVTTPIQATRPRIVSRILEHCSPDEFTPGLSVKYLNEENATQVLEEIQDGRRRFPIIELSCDQAGIYPVAAERMQSVVAGLAQVIAIAQGVDTYTLEAILGRRFSVYGGAINIIFPGRGMEQGTYYKCVLFRPDEIREIAETGSFIESSILAAITHRTNLPHSWRHVSTEIVGQAILRAKLARAIGDSGASDDTGAYEVLLQEASDQLSAKDDEIAEARVLIDRQEDDMDLLRLDNESLKHALNGVQAKPGTDDLQPEGFSSSLLKTMQLVLNDRAPLEGILRMFSKLYPNRILVLESAFSSAQESDRGGFNLVKKAFELLLKLSDDYYEALNEGKGDQVAKTVFGGAFAAKESKTLSNDGKKRRTFSYKEKGVLMEKHLKHGIKDSLAETIRIHFEWMPEDKLLVIGHCGKHLNF